MLCRKGGMPLLISHPASLEHECIAFTLSYSVLLSHPLLTSSFPKADAVFACKENKAAQQTSHQSYLSGVCKHADLAWENGLSSVFCRPSTEM